MEEEMKYVQCNKKIKFNENFLIKYIGIWNWQILSMLFLVGGLIMFALPNTLISDSLGVALIVVSLGCFFMVIKRKRELTNGDE